MTLGQSSADPQATRAKSLPIEGFAGVALVLLALRARNLHANAVRVMQTTAPYATAGAINTYSYHRADPNGNAIFDGEYFYQYDAWNRLVQINRRGTREWNRFPNAKMAAPSLDLGVTSTLGAEKYFVRDQE